MLDGVVPQLHTCLAVDYFLSVELEARLLHFSQISARFCQWGVPAGDWKVGRGEKNVPPVSDGDRNGGNTSILASNVSAVYEMGLDQIFYTEMDCMRR